MLRSHRLLIAAGLGIALSMSVVVDPALAASGGTNQATARYTVHAGDYLSGIALKLNVRVSDLLTANDLTLTSLILPGMQLTVPGRAASVATHPNRAAHGARYVVVSGDYLTGIADTLGVSTRALLVTNELSLNSLIYPGMQLKVPNGGSLPSTSAPASPHSTTAAAPASTGQTYTVVAGDFLARIAQRLGVSLASLLATNQLSASSLIYPGMLLKVPAGATPAATPAAHATTPSTTTLRYTVVSGDFLGGIAQKLGVSLARLLAANDLKATSLIRPGMQLVVPKGGTLPTAQPAAQPAANPGTRSDVATVLAYARAQLGKPYKFNTAGPATFDCSGLTLAAFERIGIALPHYSGAQMSFGTVIDWTTDAIRPGDLVFLESAPGTGVVNHVGIATSATTWIQAPRTGDVVREGHLSLTRVIGVRRVIGA